MATGRRIPGKGEPKLIVTIEVKPEAEMILEKLFELLQDAEEFIVYDQESERDNIVLLHIYDAEG
jgi:hypothetical protein